MFREGATEVRRKREETTMTGIIHTQPIPSEAAPWTKRVEADFPPPALPADVPWTDLTREIEARFPA